MEKQLTLPPKGPIDLEALPGWSEVFPSATPVEVEIGAGAGGFAIGYAEAWPDRNLVAIEQRRSLAAYIQDRAERRKLRNLVVLHADAKAALPRLFAPRSLARIHIQFPDPWWKKRHHERRLVEDEFSILLYNLLRLDGVLEVRTDVEQRGVEMAQVLEAIGFQNHHGPGALAPRLPDDVPSTRERGYLERGEPVYRYRFSRSEAPPRKPEEPLPETKVGPEHRRR